jgi:uncharacterized protein with WD repeat
VASLNAAKLASKGDDKIPVYLPDTSDLTNLSEDEKQKQTKKRNKLLRQIEELEKRKESGEDLDMDQSKKIARKDATLAEIEFIKNN